MAECTVANDIGRSIRDLLIENFKEFHKTGYSQLGVTMSAIIENAVKEVINRKWTEDDFDPEEYEEGDDPYAYVGGFVYEDIHVKRYAIFLGCRGDERTRKGYQGYIQFKLEHLFAELLNEHTWNGVIWQ